MASFFAIIIGVLITAGVFLLLSRSLVRMVLGLAFTGYGVNLTILTVAGLEQAAPPLLTLPGPHVDPLPQALVLTAIVISFGMTALVVMMALGAFLEGGDDRIDMPGRDLTGAPRPGPPAQGAAHGAPRQPGGGA